MTELLHATQAEPRPARYRLLAGTPPRPGNGGDLVATFGSEEKAREAFLALRLSSTHGDFWAELVETGDDGRVTPLCWFGDHSSPTTRSRVASGRTAALPPDEGELAIALEWEPLAAASRRPARRAGAFWAALAAVAVAIGVAAGAGAGGSDQPGDGGKSEPVVRPAPPAEQVVPFVDQPPTSPYEGVGVDG